MESLKDKRSILQRRFKEEGFVVNDGLKYGVDLLLYTDQPSKVHSKYGVLIDRDHTFLDLIGVQRTCSSAGKTLVVAFFKGESFHLTSFDRMVFKDSEEDET